MTTVPATYLDRNTNHPDLRKENGMEPAAPAKTRVRGIKKATLEVMHRNLGLHMTVEEAFSQYNGPGPVKAHQIGQALSALAIDGLVRRVGQGVYVYNPHDKPEPVVPATARLFERVGESTTKYGSATVVRDEEGQLFAVQPLGDFFFQQAQLNPTQTQ